MHDRRRPAASLAVFCLLFGWLGGGAAAARTSQESPRFKIDVRLVRVLATVRDRAGRAVAHLTPDDFEIYEQGERQSIAVFQRESEVPLRIALVLDSSYSTGKELGFEITSSTAFLRSVIGPSDRAAVYRFARQVQRLTSYTSEMARLEEATRAIVPSSGTSLFDAVVRCAKDLQSLEGRKAIVLITDGGDTTSRLGFPDALRAAQMADAAIYSIAVIPVVNASGRNTAGEHALAGLSQATGGEFFAQHSSEDLAAALAEIREALSTQYFLGYYPKRADAASGGTKQPPAPRFVPIEVRMNDSDLVVKARQGYYVDDGWEAKETR